ncbi:MAG: hypothetical protein IJ015_03200 [Ruminococcus sp.]|nr:hypothetical protein [Ruminococcus sp.]
MYLNEKRIKIIKIIGYPLFAFGLLECIVSLYALISTIVYYFDRLETIVGSVAIVDSVCGLLLATVLLFVTSVAFRLISDARFYSSYFEHDLDGKIEYSELSEITGNSASFVSFELSLFRSTIMKNFEIKNVGSKKHIELNSKKYTCQCQSCGAAIEKSDYFVGECSYCGSSDLFAKVITDDRFYCITRDTKNNPSVAKSYVKANLEVRKVIYILMMVLSVILMGINLLYTYSCITRYNDEDYLLEVLFTPGNHLNSFELIKADLMDSMIFGIFIVIGLIPVFVIAVNKLWRCFTASLCSSYLAKVKGPFVKISSLPQLNICLSDKSKMKLVKAAICNGYLTNCTFEKHNDEVVVALSKKVVKDKCPSCGAPITGAVDENYQCRYCGNLIMNVVIKK